MVIFFSGLSVQLAQLVEHLTCMQRSWVRPLASGTLFPSEITYHNISSDTVSVLGRHVPSIFPDLLKRAQLAPLHKKNDPTDKKIFRSVNVITTISKLYENILSEQLCQYFDDIFIIILVPSRRA